MVSPLDASPQKLIKEVANLLKEKIKAPEYAAFVKTGVHKERPPQNTDWWYIRAASILRNIYKHGPIGVSRLRTKYGGKKKRGVKPEKFRKASGAIIRKILQQLESAGLITKSAGKKKGRILTSSGQSLLTKAAIKTKSE
ncbi:MAG: 30S ribosomal protein S19e [Candidatus Nanoarchaeia archaeon]